MERDDVEDSLQKRYKSDLVFPSMASFQQFSLFFLLAFIAELKWVGNGK